MIDLNLNRYVKFSRIEIDERVEDLEWIKLQRTESLTREVKVIFGAALG